ncbi:putative small auxin-up RNA [Rosa chinensis]|uniref:Putative small auxin-up RNA n=1 Tax=Rosa chinensis TaxID=74649 RepID=A0A2P6PQB3_ROSCH|nr:putative small auxin-up RNA [Rosa chinensis]
MGFRLPGIVSAKKSLIRSLSTSNTSKNSGIPKGYFVVYVGESQKKRSDLLSQAEEEFGYGHAMGSITMPCSEHTFLDLTTRSSV